MKLRKKTKSRLSNGLLIKQEDTDMLNDVILQLDVEYDEETFAAVEHKDGSVVSDRAFRHVAKHAAGPVLLSRDIFVSPRGEELFHRASEVGKRGSRLPSALVRRRRRGRWGGGAITLSHLL